MLNFTNSLLLLSAALLALPATAELKPMDDTAMEATVGQAYIKMDSDSLGIGLNEKQYSRITFGQDVLVQANADSLDLGVGYNSGTDFSATNLSLGYIDTASNTIVPFEFTNPYFEWVTDATTNNMIGFRVGAEQSKGLLQMDLTSFSGNIGMTIDGVASSLYSGVGGTATNNRATHIGTTAGGCTDDTTCVSLGNIKSLDVAGSEPDGSTADFFLSFQKEATSWVTSTGTQVATAGFFMNIPSTTNLQVQTSASSTARYAVEFIDRGVVNGGTRWNVPATP